MDAWAGLVVRAPDGRTETLDLDGPVTIGRATPYHRPDVVLDPDPKRWVGRAHCTVRPREGSWVVTDGGTVNGTLLGHSGVFQRVEDERRLHHGDEILILGDVADTGEPVYWRLTFSDPFATHAAPDPAAPETPQGPPALEYDTSSAQVFRRQGRDRVEVQGLRPKAHTLVRFMVARAVELRSPVAVCTHEELLEALFGPRSSWAHDRAYTEQDVRDVVSDARRALEPDRAQPVVLQTVRGMGYRVVAWLPPS